VALVLVSAVVPAWRSARHAVAGRAASAVTGAVIALSLLGAAAGSLGTVLLRPLGWWSLVWAGAPAGTGLDPHGDARVLGSDVVAVVLLGVACGLAVGLLRGALRAGARAAAWAAAPAFAVAVPMALAAAGAPWPVVPSASLLVGLLALVAVAMRGPARSAGIVAVLVAALLALAGLSGSLPTWWATLRGLGAILVAGAVAGASARDLPARLAGWIVAAAAVPAVAYTSARAYQVGPPGVAFAVLGAAVLVLASGTVLRGRPLPIRAAGRHVRARPAIAEARAVEAAGHAGAVLALLLTAAYARPAAAVCTFWGVALGLRALWPRERAGVRRLLILAAAGAEIGGWWLLMAAEQVSTLEAYTLPAAALALLAGRLALRSRPGLTSWTAYGPALAAALLPTLASVLVGEGQPVRRLLLGLGALAVVVAGARERLRAPVVGGGLVLIAVAVHEVTLVWDLLPRWIPLAAGGLLLVGLAMTLERRRRDLARLRSALTHMS
jgi:hypothetical protein